MVAGAETPVRNIEIEDATGRVKVALWRESATSPITVGDYVTVSHAVVKTYAGDKTLQSTRLSTIEVSIIFCHCTLFMLTHQ